MTEEQLKKANDIKISIMEYENMLFVISPYRIADTGVGKISLLGRFTSNSNVKLFGERHFGCGKHEAVLAFTKDMIEDIAEIIERKLGDLKEELEAL